MIRSRRHEGVAPLNSVQGTSSLNRWPYPAKDTDNRSVRKCYDVRQEILRKFRKLSGLLQYRAISSSNQHCTHVKNLTVNVLNN